MTSPAERPLVITAGDPAGIGPDLCVDALNHDFSAALVVVGDKRVLAERARMLGMPFNAGDYDKNTAARRSILHCPVTAAVVAGRPSPQHAAHVLAQLQSAVEGCVSGRFAALVTAPVNKQMLCAAGLAFSGQTEYIAELAQVSHPVMLLAGAKMRVALATRHVPLAQVAAAITADNLLATLKILDAGLRTYFTGNRPPRIAVAGLNPHAGEGGYLGDEERRIIKPAIARARQSGITAEGPFAADSMFAFCDADCMLAMYHDQGLPVIKYADFDNTVNMTLGLPFLRTSPDHGTALELAGSGKAKPLSMRAAIALAARVLDNEFA